MPQSGQSAINFTKLLIGKRGEPLCSRHGDCKEGYCDSSGFCGTCNSCGRFWGKPIDGSCPPCPDPQIKFDESKELWKTCDSSCYNYEFSIACFCRVSDMAPKRVVVNGDSTLVISTYDESIVDEGFYIAAAIPDWFEYVQKVISEYDIDVIKYDAECGFPVLISATPDFRLSDAGTYIEIKKFQRESCEMPPDLQKEFEENKELWSTCNNSCYSYDFEISCVCLISYTDPKHVGVNGDNISVIN
eukprot:UN06391